MPWDSLKVGKTNLYGDCRQVFGHRLSKYLLPQRSVADDDSHIGFHVLLQYWGILSLCAHSGCSHKIVAIFPMYEFGIMAYDVAVIRCIVVALERNMSCPWLIEKMQILKKILKHSLSPIKYRTFATERVL